MSRMSMSQRWKCFPHFFPPLEMFWPPPSDSVRSNRTSSLPLVITVTIVRLDEEEEDLDNSLVGGAWREVPESTGGLPVPNLWSKYQDMGKHCILACHHQNIMWWVDVLLQQCENMDHVWGCGYAPSYDSCVCLFVSLIKFTIHDQVTSSPPSFPSPATLTVLQLPSPA